MPVLDDVTREVAENKSVMQSAAMLLASLAQMIRDAAGANITPALAALATELDTNTNALAAAVAANTVAVTTQPIDQV